MAAFHELGYRRLERASNLAATVEDALQEGGVWLVEARTDREQNHRLHQRIGKETARRVAEVLD